ncbi:MAG: amidase [Candidatus Lokiarchaeota archaeon]|nr:amidase [Candidatus Lokiarchaeota archaeon]
MNKEEICFMSAIDMFDAIKRQELTSIEITETIIERIEKINPITNAYCTTTFDLARNMAREADNRVKKGEKLGILNGIPTSIKDLNPVEGIRTTYGSKIFENNIADSDDIAVQRLRKEGCVIIGKTNTPEFGFKGVTDNLIFGFSRNPWNLEHTTGGSSGGAASAVVSGLGPLAQGSDGGGSIRHPSSFCGAFGLKPSYGRVPRYPTNFPLGLDLAVIGPIVRHVKDAALMLDAMKGPFEGDKASLPNDGFKYIDKISEVPEKLKIGYSLDLGYAKTIDKEVKKNILNSVELFENFGWNVEHVKMKLRKAQLSFNTIWTSSLGYNLKSYLKEWEDKMDPDLVKLVKAGLGYDGMSLPRALAIRAQVYQTIYKVFKDYDILITPSLAIPAFKLGIMYPSQINGINVSPTAWMPFSFPFNLTGHPAASIPSGWSSNGLPIGMQIIGNRFDELTVLQVSKAFEELAPWQDKRPNFS